MNWIDTAREWLVRVQGHSREPHEKALAKELRRAYELGVAEAIESVARLAPDGGPIAAEDAEGAMRRLVAGPEN